jgi:D-glycero-alpha-D-manno-heptose 1-phosphate guanylyltransferase
MSVTTAIILAGGLGTRLRSTVPNFPKPMAPVGGRPFLEYLLDYWITQGVSHFVLSVGYRHEVIIDFFGNSFKGAVLDYVIEKTPLGTGGALLLSFGKVDNDAPFLLLNGDTYFAADLNTLAAFSQVKDADWSFSMFRTNEKGRYMGMNVSQQGQLTSLNSGNRHLSRLANGGVYFVNPRALRDIRFAIHQTVSLENDIFPAAMASGQRLFGIEFPGIFIDIGVPEDYHRAPSLLVEKD